MEQQQRNQLRHLQEQEYLDSLSRDREKDEIKKIEEKEQLLRKETEQVYFDCLTWLYTTLNIAKWFVRDKN